MKSVCLVVVLLAAVACSQDETGASSTSLETSSTISTTTSSTIAGTTLPPSTTTLPPTTTTESVTTTTGAVLLPGDWAREPLIVSAFGALGWWDGTTWFQVDEFRALPVRGGEDYQVARLGVEATTTGGPEVLLCEPLETRGVELAEPELLGEWPGPYGLAISAPWRLVPHVVEEIDDSGAYSGFARELLSARGLEVANPRIKQLIRADLEGDGVNEIIVVAEDLEDGLSPMASSGDYSIAFMRKVVDGEVETAILGEDLITDPGTPDDPRINLSFTIGAVADLSGDGKMEVVVSTAYYEGLWVEVWEYFNDDFGMIPTLNVGCGA